MQNSVDCIKRNVQKSCQNSANLGAIARFLFPFLKFKGIGSNKGNLVSTLSPKLIGASTNYLSIGLNDTDTSTCIEETNTTSPF